MDWKMGGWLLTTTRESRTRARITGTSERMKRRRKRGRVSVTTTRILYKRRVNFFPPSNLISHRAIPFAIKDNVELFIFSAGLKKPLLSCS
jgi:hypothetical protein